MSYVDQHLLAGERVSFCTRLHGKLFAIPALVALLMLPLLFGALRTRRTRGLAVIPAAVMVGVLGAAYLKRRSSEFAVTNKRVIIKLGVLQTRSVELLLAKIEGIVVSQGLAGKLLGYGEIVVTGSGGTQECFAGISAPFEFRRAVQMATDLGGEIPGQGPGRAGR